MNAYAIATGLVGFPCDELRVKVLERRDGMCWVVTADLLDAGTRIVLSECKVRDLEE